MQFISTKLYKITSSLAIICLISSSLFAQESNSAVGIYYLSGVMETASGIKLNEDSTFEFFFSQGAMDRTGSGKWSQTENQIILQSPTTKTKVFDITESKKDRSRGSSISVSTENEMLLSFIHVSVSGLNPEDFVELNQSGVAEFNIDKVDTIFIIFELCPEKIHQLIPENKGDNRFKVQMLPQIFDVSFENVKLTLEGNSLKGEHPLLNGDKYYYLKE